MVGTSSWTRATELQKKGTKIMKNNTKFGKEEKNELFMVKKCISV